MALGPTHGPPDGAAETEPGQKAASQCSGPQRAGPTEHRSRFSKEAAAPLCSARCPCVPSFNPRPLEKAGHCPGQQPPAPGGYLSLNSNSVELKTQFLRGIGARGPPGTAQQVSVTAQRPLDHTGLEPRPRRTPGTLDSGHAGWLFGSHCHLSR